MKATLKWRYDTDKKPSANAIFAVNAGDVKLQASITDTTIVNCPSLTGVALALEKPGAFRVDYNVPNKDFRFQFINTIRVAQKPLTITYAHGSPANSTCLGGTMVFDEANKVSANYKLGSRNCNLTYTYLHKGLTTFEPSYDVADDSWDFAVSRRLYDNNSVGASYRTSSNILGLEWSLNLKQSGRFKQHVRTSKRSKSIHIIFLYDEQVAASLNLAEKLKLPKVSAETTFDFGI